MVVIVDLCVFLISTYIALRAVTKIYHGRYSMLHFCVLIFYAMQVLPIFVSLFGKLDKIQLYYEYMYYAMIDDSVAYIYDLFAIAGMLILSYNADKLSKYSNVSVLSNFKLGAKRQYVVAMAAICMVLPLFGIILAPHPQVYLKFSYFYMNEYSNTGVDYLCAVIISQGASIQFVKLTTSLIYLIRPILLQIYVDRNYQIDKKIEYKEEPIKQKWNGVAQHVAAVVLDGTDTIVLTVFSSLSNVSIYSVYHLVIYGVKQLFTSMTNGIQSLMGELWARQELDELRDFFGWVEWSIHTGAVLVFSCTGALVVSFIGIYTNCVTDANYIQPLFAVLLVLANAVHCLRMPYNLMILAGGHYKQTQNNYIVAAIMNITVSIVLVKAAGLIGVAIGTLVAMLYQTVWMANYDSKNLICWPLRKFMKQIFVDVLSVVCFSFCVRFLNLQAQNYLQWIYNAVKVVTVAVAITGVINWIFYRDKEKKLLSKIIKR